MTLETMEPNPAWDETAHAETVETLAAVADEVTVKVWGGDWCVDCRSALPDLAAALDAAGVEDVQEYPVEKEADGSKVGPQVETYGIEYIPTVVVERDGEELVRFVESERPPAATYIAEQLRAAGVTA